MADSRSVETIIDWVSAGQQPSDFSANASAPTSQLTLVAEADEPENYVPGGGRCVRLECSDHPTNLVAKMDIFSVGPFDLVDESCIVEFDVYYPEEFTSPVAGVAITVASQNDLFRSYSKTMYPTGVGQPRKGWNHYAYPLQSLNNTVGMIKSSEPDPTNINALSLTLQTSTNTNAPYLIIGPIRIKRRFPTLFTISFDDAISTIYDNAYPVLREFGLRATIAISTDSPGNIGAMTWDQIKELHSQNWSVSAHSTDNANFVTSGLTDAQIIQRVHDSIDAIRDQGLPCSSFTWPGGAATESAINAMREKGVNIAYTIGSDFDKVPYEYGSSEKAIIYRVPIEGTGDWWTNANAMLNEAERLGVHVHFYGHSIVTGTPANENQTNIDDFREFMATLSDHHYRKLSRNVNWEEFTNRTIVEFPSQKPNLTRKLLGK